MAKTTQYGGQAVIEGVMMRGADKLAVAVRKSNGEIVVEERKVESLSKKFPFLKWPLLRGCLTLIESLVIGIQTLTFSANQVFEEEEEEELTFKELFFTILIALSLAILLFIVIPTGIAHFVKVSTFWQNFIEGILRIGIFILYIIFISKLKDIQRVFQYHGAEHKVINAFESGEDLTIENIEKFSTLHPRCGTAFLFIVLVLTIIVFSFLDTSNLWWRVLSRVLLMPVIAGLGYEFIKLSGKYSDKRFINILIKPGLWLQKLTTRTPDKEQIEVAIRALKAVLEMEKGTSVETKCKEWDYA